MVDLLLENEGPLKGAGMSSVEVTRKGFESCRIRSTATDDGCRPSSKDFYVDKPDCSFVPHSFKSAT